MNLPDEVDVESLVAIRGGWLAGTDRQVGSRRELYFRMLDPGGLKQIPSPSGQIARLRVAPVLLTVDKELVGVVWLEGDNRQAMAVRFSRWLGITWSTPETISFTGRAQLALDATVLADGSWLVVWAGDDGEDDEIVLATVFADGSFSGPTALTDNLEPDILPTLTAHDTGAMLAWNQFDGEEYRVVVQQLFEGRWRERWVELPRLRDETAARLSRLAARPSIRASRSMTASLCSSSTVSRARAGRGTWSRSTAKVRQRAVVPPTP